ncbi:hypothetical protein LRR18_18085, partial [Mangrovimonas sp. AS39]|uniref:hypothetical protein n=1 Tax=Mangrovimonas futianensis TaxID=2895523 RepID=UPI001E6361E2
AIMDKLPEGAPRKDFAMLAKDHPDAWALFSLHDGKAIRPRLWKAERPVRPRGPNGLAFSEDTA